MEIRGLGIIDVQRIFGIRSIRLQKRVEVEVNLREWSDDEDYERVGLDEKKTNILGVEVPLVQVPITPGKNITVIAEVIALNYLVKVVRRLLAGRETEPAHARGHEAQERGPRVGAGGHRVSPETKPDPRRATATSACRRCSSRTPTWRTALLHAAERGRAARSRTCTCSRTRACRATSSRAPSSRRVHGWTHGGLLLTDFWGGSCHTCACVGGAAATVNMVIVTGVNLPLLLDYLHNRDRFAVGELAERMQQKGRDSIRVQRDLPA